MFRGESVSVIFPTYNEAESIEDAINDFFIEGIADEIIVVNNNAAAGTSEAVAKTRAKEIFEPVQGYGAALRRGMAESKGDLIILAEPDGTFSGHDILKLLAYSQDVDVVFGTRTSSTFIWEGANMGHFLKYGNFAVAKLVEFLFNTTLLTDVGCTMRLLRRNVYEEIGDHFQVNSSHFGPHLLLHIVCRRVPFVEIPVNYRMRVGESMVTGSLWKAFILGVHMIGMVLWARAATLIDPNCIYRK